MDAEYLVSCSQEQDPTSRLRCLARLKKVYIMCAISICGAYIATPSCTATYAVLENEKDSEQQDPWACGWLGLPGWSGSGTRTRWDTAYI
jgi:hypothetical protein